mmetsp:Transcript_17277/g.54249  ORF Transcript_17277/g.54249 Transcript_17277/m.54249 type:complete len:511 (-) Transcript_17277:652-2184(-)
MVLQGVRPWPIVRGFIGRSIHVSGVRAREAPGRVWHHRVRALRARRVCARAGPGGVQEVPCGHVFASQRRRDLQPLPHGLHSGGGVYGPGGLHLHAGVLRRGGRAGGVLGVHGGDDVRRRLEHVGLRPATRVAATQGSPLALGVLVVRGESAQRLPMRRWHPLPGGPQARRGVRAVAGGSGLRALRRGALLVWQGVPQMCRGLAVVARDPPPCLCRRHLRTLRAERGDVRTVGLLAERCLGHRLHHAEPRADHARRPELEPRPSAERGGELQGVLVLALGLHAERHPHLPRYALLGVPDGGAHVPPPRGGRRLLAGLDRLPAMPSGSDGEGQDAQRVLIYLADLLHRDRKLILCHLHVRAEPQWQGHAPSGPEDHMLRGYVEQHGGVWRHRGGNLVRGFWLGFAQGHLRGAAHVPPPRSSDALEVPLCPLPARRALVGDGYGCQEHCGELAAHFLDLRSQPAPVGLRCAHCVLGHIDLLSAMAPQGQQRCRRGSEHDHHRSHRRPHECCA